MNLSFRVISKKPCSRLLSLFLSNGPPALWVPLRFLGREPLVNHFLQCAHLNIGQQVVVYDLLQRDTTRQCKLNNVSSSFSRITDKVRYDSQALLNVIVVKSKLFRQSTKNLSL